MNCERDAIQVVVHQKAVWMPPELKKGAVESQTAENVLMGSFDGFVFS